MVSRNIAVRMDVYSLLSMLKLKNESFSETILRLIRRNATVLDCAGLWSDLSKKEFEEIESNIKELKKETNLALVKR